MTNVIDSREILIEYGRTASVAVLLDIERLLSVDAVKTQISPDLHGRPTLLSLRGLGKQIWNDVDAQDYVNKMRHEWEAG